MVLEKTSTNVMNKNWFNIACVTGSDWKTTHAYVKCFNCHFTKKVIIYKSVWGICDKKNIPLVKERINY